MQKSKAIAAAAVAGIMMASAGISLTAGPKDAKGECHGVNSCKGKSACMAKGSACAGQNSCKGKGWVKMTEADCKKKGGTFKPDGSSMGM